MIGTHLPFFTVWLKAVGIDAFWIGIITAVPAGDAVHGAAVRDRRSPKDARRCAALIVTAFATALGLFHARHPASAGAGVSRPTPSTCCLWTPMVPLTDAYALRRRGALWPQLRTVAAVGLGGLRGRRAGLRAAGRPHRRPKPDLGHRVGRPRSAPLASLGLQPLDDTKTARRAPPWRERACCATPAFSPSS